MNLDAIPIGNTPPDDVNVIIEVGIVYSLPDQSHLLVRETEAGTKSFKRTFLALMTEATGLIHIERYGFRVNRRITVKEEGSFGINKSPDKPGRGDAIDPWPWTCDPCTVLILRFGDSAFPGSLLRGHWMLCLVEGFFGFCLERALKKVDLGNLFKPPFQPQQLRRKSLY